MTQWAIQLITLLGVALGALASFVSTKLVDRGRWQRDERTRWDTKRLECYSEFSAAIMRFINTEYRLAAGFGLPAAVEPLDAETGFPALATAEAELSIFWAQLLILGSPEVISAAQNWRNEAWHLESFARGHRKNPAEFAAAAEQRREARRRFYAAVRADLGVMADDIPADLGIRLEWQEAAQSQSVTAPSMTRRG
jgi:hypothetical protein